MNNNVALYGMYISMSLILSYLDSMITLPFITPGIKLGLANLIVVYILYKKDFKLAVLISLVKVVLSGLLFGSGFTIVYSASGALLSIMLMYLAKRSGLFSVIAVSILGALAHNMGQLLVAVVILNSWSIGYYFAVLSISGVVTGATVGYVAKILLNRIR